MTECRVCEIEFKKDKRVGDGLCDECHRKVCNKPMGKCLQCLLILERVVEANYPAKPPQE